MGSGSYDACAAIDAIIAKLRSLDREVFFYNPVTEAIAPGYFNVIKRPMCLSKMAEKAKNREYRTWRAFMDDLVLLCNNAIEYNPKRSRVHKAALKLLDAGRRLLQSLEVEGRKAIAMLHPEGPAQAAKDEEEAKAL